MSDVKRPYEPPMVESERVFEALAAGCSITVDDSNCVFTDPFVDLLS